MGMKKYFAIFVLLWAAYPAMAGNRQTCTYLPHKGQDMVSEEDCLILPEHGRDETSAGDALVTEKVAANASYDGNGLAYLFSPAGVFYFTRSGLARKTLIFDNGPDDFSNGLARTERNGKIGFFDKALSIVIKPQYDFAYSFENDLALVCMGCIRKKEGEHTRMAGGKWGAINSKGKIIIPAVHSEAELRALLKR